MINEQKKKIFKTNVKSNVCFVTLSSCNPGVDVSDDLQCGQLTEFPVTLNVNGGDVYTIPSDITQPQEGENDVVAWDIFEKKYINIDMDDLLTWSFQSVPTEKLHSIDESLSPVEQPEPTAISHEEMYIHKHDSGEECSLDVLRGINQKLSECSRMVSLGLVDEQKIKDIISRWDCDDLAFKILKTVGFSCCCIDELMDPDEHCMEKIRKGYMNYIRLIRDESFVELDQLEQETKDNGGTDDDIKDIDTIKQMFRDIPQDLDLCECKTPIELFETWPSLLLPSPVDSVCKSRLNKQSSVAISADAQIMCAHVDNISIEDLSQLKNLLIEAEAQQPSIDTICKNLRENDTMNLPEQQVEERAQVIVNSHKHVVDHMRNKIISLEQNS